MSEVSDKVNHASERTDDHIANSVSHSWSRTEALKRDAIYQACEDGDINKLMRLTESSGGLLDDTLRQTACKPCMLSTFSLSTNADDKGQCCLAVNNNLLRLILLARRGKLSLGIVMKTRFTLTSIEHLCIIQMVMTLSFPLIDTADHYLDETEKEIDSRKAKLSNLIVQVLRQHPMLCYFQGYHDIVQVVLLVLGEHAAPAAVARISLLRIRDYMLPSLSPALKHLEVLPAILERADPSLAAHLSRTRPFFALAATLTLYAHEIQEYSDIARIFDFILAHEPVMAIYTFAAIIISRRSELLGIPWEEPEMLHFTLSKLPQPLDLEELISSTLSLFNRHPPEELPHLTWWRISPNSVLKTSRSLDDKQTLEQGEALLRSQARQLRREEQRQKLMRFAWKYRRPVASVAAALLVGAASLWLRRSGQDKYIWSFLWKVQGMLSLENLG